MLDLSFVDASFEVSGEAVPLDHGYALFSAVSRVLPQIHERRLWSVHSIHGKRSGPGKLNLDGKSSLRLRVPAQDVGELLPLLERELDIDGHVLRVGPVRLLPLRPAAALWSRFVTVKGFLEAEPFLLALRRQIAAIDGLGQDPERVSVIVGQRRVMRVKEQTVVGFHVELDGLEAQASLALQRTGLGGRRHMGAGVFIPLRRRSQ